MKKMKAFTMAEILISLTIIGVIAALTLPALMANLNEKVWNTQRKALHSRMAQALAAMPRLDGYQENSEGSAEYNFILNGLSTALNITKVCERGKMDKCDFAISQYTMNDEAFSSNGAQLASFNTVNGESISVVYNQNCTGSSNSDFLSSNSINNMKCAEFMYDLNGASKGPNKMGKDMGFIAAFFPEYPVVVAPMPMAATNTEIGAEDVEGYIEANPDFRLPSPAEATLISTTGLLILSEYEGRDISVWTDNDVFCAVGSNTCVRAGSNGASDKAYLILVSKNGDGPRTFKILGNTGEKCSKNNPGACKTYEDCQSAGGSWNKTLNGPECVFDK